MLRGWLLFSMGMESIVKKKKKEKKSFHLPQKSMSMRIGKFRAKNWIDFSLSFKSQLVSPCIFSKYCTPMPSYENCIQRDPGIPNECWLMGANELPQKVLQHQKEQTEPNGLLSMLTRILYMDKMVVPTTYFRIWTHDVGIIM